MGHIHPQTASRSQPEKKEGREFEEKWKVKISYLENGQIFYAMLPINKSCLGLFPIRWQPCIALKIKKNHVHGTM